MSSLDNVSPRTRRLLSVFVDLSLLSFAALFTGYLSSGSIELNSDLVQPLQLLLMLVLAVPIFYASGFYSQIWRFASINQYLYLFTGTLLHSAALALVFLAIGQPLPLPVHLIFWMQSFIMIVGVRVLYRVAMNRRLSAAHRSAPPSEQPQTDPVIRVMVIGAGHAGSQIIRELLEVRDERHPVVLIDDDPHKHNKRIHGIDVVGDRSQISDAVAKFNVQEIILAMPSASSQVIRETVRLCSDLPCKLRTLPRLADLVSGRISFSQIKDVDIEDLLGRQTVRLDTAGISGYLKNQVVLVTGGGGSIGSELCRQIARYQPERLIIFDIYENNAYQLQQELKSDHPELALEVLIGSVRDKVRLDVVFEKYQPQIIFHAAAHKHVPLMEDSPSEAVKNNIFGTFNVAEKAGQYKAQRFVLISTDKAVNPTNVMGASKRLAEMIMQTMNQQYPQTAFSAVRFGNVLGSSGSVIPLFKQQIAQQRRVIVTDPEITRYFMTIPEAAGLVIQAGSLARGGEIFVLDMGEPVKILDLAYDLIRLSGLKPHIDVEIVYSGLRPGEKMYEELLLDSEENQPTVHEKIMPLRPVCELEDIRLEIDRLRQLIRWDHANFRSLRQDLFNGYNKVIEASKCDFLPAEATQQTTTESAPENQVVSVQLVRQRIMSCPSERKSRNTESAEA